MRKTFAMTALMLMCTTSARAQRFEGVITMRLNAGAMQFGAGAIGVGPGAGRGDAGRGNVGRGGDGRGADGRGGRGTLNDGRGGRGDAQGARGAQPDMGRGGRGGAPTEIEYMTRHGKVRIALGGMGGGASPGAVIYDQAEGMIYTLFPAGSMYMQTTFDAFVPSSTDTTPGAVTRREAILRAPIIVHTKKFDMIAEHRCEHVLVTVAKQQTDVCMAKGLGTFVLPTGMGRAEAWQSVLTESNGFPLRVTGADGRVAVEVTKVERKALPASLFTVPDSYTRMPDRLGRPPG